MKYSKKIFLILPTIFLLIAIPKVIFANFILDTYKTASFLDADIDNNGIKDKINFKPTNGTPVTVTDTLITGNAWGETVGWINFNPTNGGVINTCNGVLSGYAWGQNTGWINFNPTNGGVTINTGTGNFSGYAWSENYGWIHFDPTIPEKHVQTNWRGCVTSNPSGFPPVDPNNPDVCPNISGTQPTLPVGYKKEFGICTPVVVTACNDGIDNDGDGSIDLGDAGCVSLVDDSENNPIVIFACNDGIDNDGDGNTDLNDPGCVGIYDLSEYNITPKEDPKELDKDTSEPPVENPTVYNTVDSHDSKNSSNGFPIIKKELKTTPIISGVRLSKIRSIVEPIKTPAIVIAVAGAVSTLPGFVARIGHFLLTALIYRRRNPWGVVYDSKTGQPLDPAIVTVIDVTTGNQVEQKTTDMEGRYGFYLKPGTYRITAGKTNYQFPSELLLGRASDGRYDHLYFGDEFTIPEGRDRDRVVTMNIPMDPTSEDWNQSEKKRMGLMGYLTKHSPVWNMIARILFVLGFTFSAVLTFLYPVKFNFIVLGIYVLVLIFGLLGVGSITAGVVTRANKPLANVMIRIYNSSLKREVAHRITDSTGHYYILVPNGEYYATISETLADGTSNILHTTEIFEVTHGVMNENFTL